MTALFCLAPAAQSADNWKPYIDWLKKELGKDTPSKEDYDNVRDTKLHGDNYMHIYQTTVDGKGKVTKKYKWWFDSKKTVNFSHSSKAVLREKIISTREELEKGIVKSEFTVLNFTEQFGVCTGNISFGILSSDDVLKGLVGLGNLLNKHQDTITKMTMSTISASAGILLAPAPEPVHKAAALTALLTAAGVEAATRLTGWLLGNKLSKNVNENGEWILSEETTRKLYPGFEKVLAKMRNLEGTKVRSVWEYGKGYTKIDISNTLSDVTEEDKQMIAKLIYRTNPVGARHFYPKNKENKKKWIVGAKDFEAVLSICGVEFNHLQGEVQVRNRGIKYRKFDDENALKRKEVPVATLDIDKNHPNMFIFSEKFENKDALRVKMIPRGKILIATKKAEEKDAPTYIKEISCTGDLENVMRKHIKSDSLLRTVEMEESSVKINGNYQQIRYRDE